MQEAITKTHGSALTELQRQFETKERMVRSQLLSLGSALPVLQMHLMLCTAFTSGATKYQFLELAHPMLERLSRVAQLGYPSRPPLLTAHLKSNYKNEFARALQPYVGQTQTQKESLYDQTQTMAQQDPPVIQVPRCIYTGHLSNYEFHLYVHITSFFFIAFLAHNSV